MSPYNIYCEISDEHAKKFATLYPLIVSFDNKNMAIHGRFFTFILQHANDTEDAWSQVNKLLRMSEIRSVTISPIKPPGDAEQS